MHHYLLHIPNDMGKEVGAMLSQEDAELLVGTWPELNFFLEPEMEVG